MKNKTELEVFGDAMHNALMEMPDKKQFKKAKSAFLDSIWEDMEYTVIDGMSEAIEGFVRRMSENTIKEILEGRDDQMRRYLSLDGYTGRSDSQHGNNNPHPVIHGKLFETGAVALRKKIVDAHHDLIKCERIKDLEDQVKCLVAQVNEKENLIELLRENRV